MRIKNFVQEEFSSSPSKQYDLLQNENKIKHVFQEENTKTMISYLFKQNKIGFFSRKAEIYGSEHLVSEIFHLNQPVYFLSQHFLNFCIISEFLRNFSKSAPKICADFIKLGNLEIN